MIELGSDDNNLEKHRLLLNDQGDAHIGEWATVDVRIAPNWYEKGLPTTVQEVFGWPVKC